MKQLGWICWAGLVVACGGRASAPQTDASGGAPSYAGSPAEDGGATNSAGSPGVGPIDTTDLPEAFPEPLCEGPLKSLHLALPCKIGQPLSGQPTGGFSAVECYDTAGRTALSFAVDLEIAANWIGRPRPIRGTAPGELPLPTVPSATIEVEGVPYTGVLNGSLTFQQVDPQGRAFVAFITREFIAWTAPDGTTTDCDYDPMQLWATAGDFM